MDINKCHSVYFLGIGGIGMSALARYFLSKGCIVAGYDRTCSPLTRKLSDEGMMIHYNDDPEMIPHDIDLVIFTPAIPQDCKELGFLSQRDVPMMKRAEVLGELSRHCRTIAVSGSHGKTTTTALITHILLTAGKKMSAFIGGIAKNIDSNVVIGDDDDEIMVMEADEFDHSFLQLNPFISIVTSIDADHLDIYGDKQHLIDGFNQFVNKTSDNGLVIYHENLPIVTKLKTLTYGNDVADMMPRNIKIENGLTKFIIKLPGGRSLGTFKMQLYGLHNVMNAVAAVAACLELGLDKKVITKALETFSGVRRRFDFRVRNEKVSYIDDYAHHPEEIKASIRAARDLFPSKKLTLIFQPHLFSRTRDFMDGFAESLSLADSLMLLDIYPAREKPIEGVTSSALLEKITCPEKQLCQKDKLLDLVQDIHPELLMTMGAGDIDRFVPELEKILNQ